MGANVRIYRRGMVGLGFILCVAILVCVLPIFSQAAQAAVSNSVIYDLSPGENELNVSDDGSITFYFREAMKASTINEDTVYMRLSGSSSDVAVKVSYRASSRKVTIAPSSKLISGSKYSVYLTDSIRYGNEARIIPQSWTFAIENQSTQIVDCFPASGATVTTLDVVSFRFVQKMDETTIDDNSVYLQDETADKLSDSDVSYNSTTGKVTIKPLALFSKGHQYRVNVTSAVRYEDGTRIADTGWSFKIVGSGSTTGQTDPLQQGQWWLPSSGSGVIVVGGPDGVVIGPSGMSVGGPGGIVIGSGGEISMGQGNSSKQPSVWIHGGSVSFNNVKPYIKNNRTMLPMRDLFEKLGADVKWNQSTQKVTATINGNTLVLQIGSKTAYKNGEKITLDSAAEISDGSTMIPLRFVGEGLGMTVKWDADSKAVTLED